MQPVEFTKLLKINKYPTYLNNVEINGRRNKRFDEKHRA